MFIPQGFVLVNNFFSIVFFSPELFQKTVYFTVSLVTGKGIDVHGVDRIENTPIDIGIVLAQPANQDLYLFAFAAAGIIIWKRTVFRKTAGALNKVQLVISLPGENILLMDTIKRTNQRHALKILAVEFGQHGLQLGAVNMLMRVVSITSLR